MAIHCAGHADSVHFTNVCIISLLLLRKIIWLTFYLF